MTVGKGQLNMMHFLLAYILKELSLRYFLLLYIFGPTGVLEPSQHSSSEVIARF